MTFHNRVFMMYLSIMVSCSSMAMSEVVSNDLKVSVSVFTNTIYPNVPVSVQFEVENMSSRPISVIPPSIGSMDVIDDANASVIPIITYPSGKKEEIRYGNPYIGPMKEVDSVRISEVIIPPKGCIVRQLILGGSWRMGRAHTIFAQEGLYSIAFMYYPFTVKGAKGLEKIDETNAIYLPGFSISVSNCNAVDTMAWQEIRELKYWWILYDPGMRNVKYIPESEQQALTDDLKKIAADYSTSIYHQYLEYGSVALQLAAPNKKHKMAVSDAVEKLELMANDCSFAYRSLARQLCDEIEKK